MIQLNLLPAIKLEYVRARRNKRLALLGSGLVAGVSLLVLVLLFANVQLQAKHSRDLSQDIKTESKKLEGVEDISSILTIQNQLVNLQTLHASKPEANRIAEYLRQTTPAQVVLSKAEVDFEAGTISLEGESPSVAMANAHVDTLKFTTYTTRAVTDPKNAFSEVVLVSVTPNSQESKVTYSVTFKFDPAIFSNQEEDIKLSVPKNKITTRSQLDRPDAVFAPQEGQ